MLLEWMLRFMYRYRPSKYIELSRQLWNRTNPDLVSHCDRVFGESQWPGLLWVEANKYIDQGGRKHYPRTSGIEDALLRDASKRRDRNGPIKNVIDRLSKIERRSLDRILTPEGQEWLSRKFSPLLDSTPRLDQVLTDEELVQEIGLMIEEVKGKPWTSWPIGKRWTAGSLDADEKTLKKIVGAYVSWKYRSNTSITRNTEYVEELPEVRDPTAENGFQEADARLRLEQLIIVLPEKQREAVEFQWEAENSRLSLEEVARGHGKDPARVRENFKAVQRKYRGRSDN